jgi:hypothetical protein
MDDLTKAEIMIMSLQHLQHYSDEGERFLDLTASGDETWVLHFTPESKQQSMVWKHLGLPVRKNFHRKSSIGKLMLMVFRIAEGNSCRISCHEVPPLRQLLWHTRTSGSCHQVKVPGDSHGQCGSPP